MRTKTEAVAGPARSLPWLARDVGRRLVAAGWTVAVAESCTGGLLGGILTSVPGSSVYVRGGVIAYANAVKTGMLGVRASVLRREGAVSAAVARQMAAGVLTRTGADCGVAITGVAGPGGGTEAKPVGLVFVAVASAGRVVAREYRFDGSRARVRREAVRAALMVLREYVRETDSACGRLSKE
jgi:PncC family amidohydrolase